MGFIHTMYYYQVEKSKEDAKKEEARVAKERQQQNKNARINRRQQLMGKRPNNPRVRQQSAANYSSGDYANIDDDDLEDSFGM